MKLALQFQSTGMRALMLTLACAMAWRQASADGNAAEVKMEAERFRILSGWRVAGPEEGYFPSRPNEWSGDKLIADPGADSAEAVKQITLPRGGDYHLWVHYESPYGFDGCR